MRPISTPSTPSTPLSMNQREKPVLRCCRATVWKSSVDGVDGVDVDPNAASPISNHFRRVLPRGRSAAGTQSPEEILFAEIFTNEMPRWTTI